MTKHAGLDTTYTSVCALTSALTWKSNPSAPYLHICNLIQSLNVHYKQNRVHSTTALSDSDWSIHILYRQLREQCGYKKDLYQSARFYSNGSLCGTRTADKRIFKKRCARLLTWQSFVLHFGRSRQCRRFITVGSRAATLGFTTCPGQRSSRFVMGK